MRIRLGEMELKLQCWLNIWNEQVERFVERYLKVL